MTNGRSDRIILRLLEFEIFVHRLGDESINYGLSHMSIIILPTFLFRLRSKTHAYLLYTKSI